MGFPGLLLALRQNATGQISAAPGARVPHATRPGRPAGPRGFAGVMAGTLAALALAMVLPASAQAAREVSYEAQVQYERGAHALRTGDVAGALVFLERAVRESPDFVEALSLYGSTLLADGQDAQAAKILERLAEVAPNKSANFYLGIANYRMENWAEAVRHLTAAQADHAQSGQLQLYLGISYQELGKLEDARSALERASELDPSLAGPAEYRLGVMALDGPLAEAQKHFATVRDVAPGSDLANSADEYVDRIGAGYFRKWGFAASLGGGYDTNVSLAGEAPFITGIESGLGTAQLSGRATLVDRDWLVIDSGAAAGIQYHGGAPENRFDHIATQGWIRSTSPLTSELDLSLTYNFQYVWADYSAFRSTHAGDIRLRFSPKGSRLTTHLYFHFESRDYLFDLSILPQPTSQILDRDGSVKRSGFDQYVYTGDWWGWGPNYAMVGFRYRREHSKGTEYDSHGVAPKIAIGVQLPRKMLWTASLSFEWRNFDNPSCRQSGAACLTIPTGSADRRDRILALTSGLRIPLNRTLYADLRYRFWDRDSNYAFYQYQRNLADIRVTYLY